MESNNLDELKTILKPKLCVKTEPIDEATVEKIFNGPYFVDLIEIVLLKIDENDAGTNVIKILDYWFRKEALLANLYDKLSSNKIKYILIDYLTEKFNDSSPFIEPDDLNYLIESFRRCLNKPFEETSQIDTVELVKLSDLMCLLSIKNCVFDRSLINRELISLLIENLNYCHQLGKTEKSIEDNPFKMITKLSQVNDPDSFSKETFFGFKRNLVRLLANLAYENEDVQNWIRELDGISLLLDCANIDARNPFIMQWSIFALKSILHDNLANQEFVRSIVKKDGPIKFDLSRINNLF